MWVGILVNKLKNIFMVPIKEKNIKLNLYKILQPKLHVFFVCSYLTFFITTLFSLKVYRSVREVSLKHLYGEILNFFLL
jgi:hypothetical protein